MKKIIAISILALLMLFACGSPSNEVPSSNGVPYSKGPSSPPTISEPTTPQP